MLLKLFQEQGKMEEAEVFVRDFDPDVATEEEFKAFLADPYTIEHSSDKVIAHLPYGLKTDGRDDSKDLLTQTMLPHFFWYDKTILDVACSTGGWGLECLHNAAKYVTGFDPDYSGINILNKMRSLFKYEDKSRFFISWFADIDWNTIPQHDVLFLNQCIYNIPEGENVLDITNDKCKNVLIMYTWFTDEENYYQDPNCGFRPSWTPTLEAVKKKLVGLGYKYVYIVINSNVTEEFMKNPTKKDHKHMFIGAREVDKDSQFYFMPSEEFDVIELAPRLRVIKNRFAPTNI